MAKGIKTGGRQANTPNKVTRDVRAAIAAFAEANVDSIGEWLNDIDDPAKRLDLFLRALEYHVPKLARQEITGKDGEPVHHAMSVDFGPRVAELIASIRK